ncbi:TIGR02206 family membrane protein [Bacillus sp. FSL H8-0547]
MRGEGVEEYLQYRPGGDKFSLFSAEHIWTLVIISVFILGIMLLKKSWMPHQQPIRLALAAVLFLALITHQIWLLSEHAWSAASALPLHLSDLSVILAFIMLINGSEKLFQFLYFAGIASSVQALLTPDLGTYHFPHFQYLVFFISHGTVILAVLVMLMAFSYKITFRTVWVCVLIVNLYAAIIFAVNKWLGSNYMFLMKKPEGVSLLNVLGKWPWYLIWAELIMIVSFLLLFWMYKRGRLYDQS